MSRIKRWRGADDDDRDYGYWTWRPDSAGVVRRVRVPGRFSSVPSQSADESVSSGSAGSAEQLRLC
jgi:hypothetical protein